MKLRATLFVFAVTIATSFAASVCAEPLAFSHEDGKIEFVGSKDDGRHDGGFKQFSGELEWAANAPQDCTLSVTIDTGSLWSDHPKLTAHLKNQDFFDVTKFPQAKFVARGFQIATAEDKKAHGDAITHVISGKLTLLGVTESIDLPTAVTPAADHLNLSGAFMLDRTRFGMNYAVGKVHKGVKVSFEVKVPR